MPFEKNKKHTFKFSTIVGLTYFRTPHKLYKDTEGSGTLRGIFTSLCKEGGELANMVFDMHYPFEPSIWFMLKIY